MSYDVVLFDMDGVLVPNSPRWAFERAAAQALEASGVDAHVERDRDLLSGFPTKLGEAESYFADQYGVSLADVWRRRERFASANQLRLLRAGKKEPYEDIDVLPTLEADLAVVSNNQHATVESVVRLHNIEQYVEVWSGLEPGLRGVRRRKPAPWYLQTAHDSLEGDTALYVGDQASDVAAATHAGMDSALLTRTGDPAEVEPSPTYHLSSLAALPTLVDGREDISFDEFEGHFAVDRDD